MPEPRLPGAELHLLDDAPMVGDGGARVIHHITWDRNASATAPQDLVPFDNLLGYFTGAGAGMAPHLLVDPFTGRIAQFFSANSRAKAVVNAAGGVETNRKGNVCIQIEWLFFPYCRVGGKVYASLLDTPMRGLDRVMAWLRSWGVPDVWPMGEPAWSANRNAQTWNTRSGHYGHSQVPENDHTDPGPMPDIFQQEETVTPDDIKAIAAAAAEAVWNRPVKIPRMQPDGSIKYEGPQGAEWPLIWGNVFAKQSEQRDADLKAAVVTLQGTVTALAALIGKGGGAAGMTPEQVEAAVLSGVAKALARAAAAVK